MYLSFAQSALTLLSLGTILGAISAPASTQESSVSLIEVDERVAVPDITKHGYQILDFDSKATLRPEQQWIVRKNGIDVDILGINIAQKQLIVFTAANILDVAVDKVKLRGIILSV